MNTMQLKCFMAVAESLSFAAAARQLSVTQPAVTQQIRALEDELGAKLFERTTRSVKLTPAGLTFLADARGMLTIYERSLGRFAHAEKLEFLPFSIGAQSHCELLALTEALHTLKSSVPTLLPSFQIFPFPYLADRLREGAIDAVIAFEEEGRRKRQLRFKSLGRLPIALVTGRAYDPLPDLGVSSAAGVDVLTGQRLLLLDPMKHPVSFDRFQHELLADRIAESVQFCETIDAAVLLARSGCGVAVLPLFPSLAQDASLCCRPLEHIAPLSYGVHYLSLSDKPLIRTFIEACSGLFPDQ